VLALLLTFCFFLSSSGLFAGVEDGIFIIGLWGRAGDGGGIENDIIPNLKSQLQKLHIPEENFIVDSWNPESNSTPGPKPSTRYHLSRLTSALDRAGVKKPKFLAIIGHSFGGWAAARLSKLISSELGYIPDVVYLFDPVVWKDYAHDASERDVVGKFSKSFYQENSVFDVNPCLWVTSIGVVAEFLSDCRITLNASCGSRFNGLTEGSERIEVRRRRNGVAESKNCGFSSFTVPISHTSIDDDTYLQRNVSEHILRKVRNIIEFKDGEYNGPGNWIPR
jgi:hypothetical protein